MSEKSQITYTRHETITLPSPEQEKRYGIRYQDWERCKKKLRKIKKQVPRFHLIYSFFFGVSASSFSALITSSAQSQASLPSWIFLLYWALSLFGLIIGISFVYVDKIFRKEQQSDLDEIIEDMESIEETFPNT